MKLLHGILILITVRSDAHSLDAAFFVRALQSIDNALGEDSVSDLRRRHFDLIHNPPPLKPVTPAQKPLNPHDALLDAIRTSNLKKSHSEQTKEEELDFDQKKRIARRKAVGDDESDDESEWPEDHE